MFGKEFVDIAKHREAQAAAATGRTELSAIIAGLAPGPAVPDVTLVAWSIVHGYTTRCVEAGPEGREKRAERARLFARTVAAEFAPAIHVTAANFSSHLATSFAAFVATAGLAPASRSASRSEPS